MSGADVEQAARFFKPGTRVGDFNITGDGVSHYEVREAVVPPGSELADGFDTSLVVTDRAQRPRAIIALRGVDSGEPLVDIVQINGSIDATPRLLPKILETTYQAAHAQRLRMGHRLTNVSPALIRPNVGLDPSNPRSHTFVFPPNVPRSAKAA